jgi:predicted nucleic acid-binding protein
VKLIADANILFSLVKKGSVTEELVCEFSLQLYSVDYVLDELEKHKAVLLKKSGLSSFTEVKALLEKHVMFVKASELHSELKDVKKLVSDEHDLLYFALAKKLRFLIWSNDKHFKEQDVFDVVTTKDLIEILF